MKYQLNQKEHQKREITKANKATCLIQKKVNKIFIDYYQNELKLDNIECDEHWLVAEEYETFEDKEHKLFDDINHQLFRSIQKSDKENSKYEEDRDNSKISRDSWASLVNQWFNYGILKKPKNRTNESCSQMSILSDRQSATIEFGNFITEKYSTDEMDPPLKFLRKWNCASVMIVDDSPFNLLILNEIFSKIIPQKYTQKSECNIPQFRIDEASNGKQALNKVKDTIGKTWCKGYELILMDLSMPIMDGPTAWTHIIELQDENKINKDLKIIAVTAYDSPEHKEMWNTSGMKGFLNKPITIQDIKYSLCTW